MDPQAYSWTCSVCSFTWVIQATNTAYADDSQYDARYDCGLLMGYPNCVNPTYGCMSATCLINAFAEFNLKSEQAWVTFDQAYAIMRVTTGLINPVGMYHFMACRGVKGADLWVANSAPGYDSVWDTLDRATFNRLGPVQMIFLVP